MAQEQEDEGRSYGLGGHMSKLSDLLFQTNEIDDEAEAIADERLRIGKEITFSENLKFGQIPVMPAEMLDTKESVEITIHYSQPDNHTPSQDSSSPLDDLVVVMHLAVEPKEAEHDGVSRMRMDPYEMGAKLEKVMADVYYPHKLSHRKLKTVYNPGASSQTIRFWYAQDKPISWKMEYLGEALREFFEVAGYELSDVSLGHRWDEAKMLQDLSDRETTGKEEREESVQEAESLNVNGFTKAQINPLADYLTALYELDNEITQVVDTQRNPVVFDTVLPLFEHLSGQTEWWEPTLNLSVIRAYTSNMERFAQEDKVPRKELFCRRFCL